MRQSGLVRILALVVFAVLLIAYVRFGMRTTDSADHEKRERLAKLRDQEVVFGLSISKSLITEQEGTVGAVYRGRVVMTPSDGGRKRVLPLGQIRWLQQGSNRWGPW